MILHDITISIVIGEEVCCCEGPETLRLVQIIGIKIIAQWLKMTSQSYYGLRLIPQKGMPPSYGEVSSVSFVSAN